MDVYGIAEDAKNKIMDASTMCDTLIAELTEDILQTSVGSISTLQEKITQLKTTLDDAVKTIEDTVKGMKDTEKAAKGSS